VEKGSKPEVLRVPVFEPLDSKMVPRLRQKYAEKVMPILEAKLQAIQRHLKTHPSEGERADLAWGAIQRRIKAINAWISGMKPT
jgi:hypothetical protein